MLKVCSDVPKHRKRRPHGTDSQNVGSWMLNLGNTYKSIMNYCITKEWEDKDIIISNQYSSKGKRSCHPKNKVRLVFIRF